MRLVAANLLTTGGPAEPLDTTGGTAYFSLEFSSIPAKRRGQNLKQNLWPSKGSTSSNAVLL